MSFDIIQEGFEQMVKDLLPDCNQVVHVLPSLAAFYETSITATPRVGILSAGGVPGYYGEYEWDIWIAQRVTENSSVATKALSRAFVKLMGLFGAVNREYTPTVDEIKVKRFYKPEDWPMIKTIEPGWAVGFGFTLWAKELPEVG